MTAPPQDEEKLMTRVRKLLAKAEGATTEHERDSYNEKAASLIATYGLDEAMIAASDPDGNQPGDTCVDIDDPYAIDRAQLLASIGRALRVKAVLRAGRDTSAKRRRRFYQIHLFGMAADIERTMVMYESLLIQMLQWAAVAKPTPTVQEVVDAQVQAMVSGRIGARFQDYLPKIRGDQLTAYRRAWMAGFAYGISQRIERQEEEALRRRQRDEAASWHRSESFDPYEEKPPGVELVLVDQAEKIAAAVGVVYPELKEQAPRQLSGGSQAMKDGYTKSHEAAIGGQGMLG